MNIQMNEKTNQQQPGSGYGFSTSQDEAWTLEQVVQATGGKLVSKNGRVFFRSVSTDSRTIEAGDLFVALSGENFNGCSFF